MDVLTRAAKKPAGEVGPQVRGLSARLPKTLEYLGRRELAFVRVMLDRASGPRLRALNRTINHLGNGWIYPGVALLLLGARGWEIWPVLAAAALSAGLAHSIYPRIKQRVARPRPCDLDPSLRLPIPALDRYSFPSGHTMTAAAVGLPLGIAIPHTVPAIAVVWLAIAWSRVALGHHYPSDLVFGGLLGLAVAAPVTMTLVV